MPRRLRRAVIAVLATAYIALTFASLGVDYAVTGVLLLIGAALLAVGLTTRQRRVSTEHRTKEARLS